MEKNCENCNTKKATLLCHACNAILCPDCDATIHKFGIFSSHSRKPLGGLSAAGICPVHNSRIVAVCDTCKETCCCECLIEKHTGHIFTEYLNAFQRRQDEFEQLKKNVKTSCEVGKIIVDTVQQEISQLDSSKTKTIGEINESFAHFEQLLAARKAKLIEEVTETTTKRGKKLQEISSTIEEQVTMTSKLDTDAKDGDAIAQGIEMEKALMVINDKISNLLSKETPEIEAFTYTDKQIEKKFLSTFFPSRKDGGDVKYDVMDFDLIANSFGVLTISPKYISKKTLSFSIIFDETSKINRPDIDDTSVGLTWDAPDAIKTLVSKSESVVFVLERKDVDKKEPENDFRKVKVLKETSTRDTGLENAKEYSYRVRCCIIPTGVPVPEDANVDVLLELWCSSVFTIISGGFPGVWREGPYYTLSEDRTIATKDDSKGSFYGLALGSAPIPMTGVTKWRFEITKYCGSTACVGVAPADADQSIHNPYETNGFYICTCDCELHAGPPYDYSHKDYASGKVSTGGYIDVIVNMDERTISFNCNGKTGPVAYRNIPVDKPLVPAAAFDEPTDAFKLVPYPVE